MIKKLFPLLIILLFSFFEYGEESKPKKEYSRINEIIEVVGNIAQNKSVQSISVINKEKMEKFRLNSLKSLISTVPGVLSLSTGRFGQASSTYIRGSNSTQVLYIVDGVKVRNFSSIGGVSLATISPFLINKVEIVRGPLSSVYGSDAMGGVISVDTDTRNGIKFESSVGSHGSYLGNVSWSKKFGDFNISIASANQFYTDNIKNDKFKNNGFKARIDYQKKSFKTGFRFFGNITDSGIPFNMNKPSLQRKFNRFNYVAAIPLEFRFNKTTKLRINLSYNRNNYKFEDKENKWNPYFKNISDNKAIEGILVAKLFKGLDFHGGIDYSFQNIFTENKFKVTIDNVKTNFFSSFVLLNYELGDFLMTGSLRYDKYKDVDSNISPQIGFSYLFNKTIKIKMAYSGSFKAPLPVHQINPWGASNFKLKPEKGKSYEVGLDIFIKKLTAGITYFNTEYTNLIDWVTIDFTKWTGQYQNIKGANIKGIELELSYLLFKNLNLNLSYAYLDGKDKKTNKPLPRRPKHTVAFSFIYSGKIFTLSGMFRYVGKRPDLDFSSHPPQIDNPPFNTYDLTTTIPLNKSFSVFFKMTNLFDKDYQEFFGYPAPGRRIEAGITYKN